MAERSLLHRIHNPRNYECGCDHDCWCRRTAIGRGVKWWFPARWFGIHHKNSFFDGMSWDEIRQWKQEQQDKGMYPIMAQPRYESIVRLGRGRWGFSVRQKDGTLAIHETLGRPRHDTTR